MNEHVYAQSFASCHFINFNDRLNGVCSWEAYPYEKYLSERILQSSSNSRRILGVVLMKSIAEKPESTIKYFKPNPDFNLMSDPNSTFQSWLSHRLKTSWGDQTLQQCFSTFLLQGNHHQMFALLMETYTVIQVSILLQSPRVVVVNFLPGKFGLFRRNPWTPGNHSQNPEVPRNPGWQTQPYRLAWWR